MQVFTLTGLDQFFQMLSCEVDAKRCHKLLMTLQEDGTCMLSDLEGEPMELNLTPHTVTRALKIQEGNYNISSMKMNIGDRLIAFMGDKANKSVYAALRVDEVRLALQIHQQYFHIYKPQKYKHPKTHTTYLFSMTILKKQQMKAGWGVKILKDIKKAGPSYQRTGYIRNGVVLTRIVYEALGIRSKIQLMPHDKELLETIESQRARNHK